MLSTEGYRWIRAAENDIDAAQALLLSGHYHICAFVSQQSAEKALKGLLRLLGRIPWGHNCSDLLGQIEQSLSSRADFLDLFEAVNRLDGHYIPSRYPDAFPEGVPADYYTQDAAQQALEDANKVVAFVKAQLDEI